MSFQNTAPCFLIYCTSDHSYSTLNLKYSYVAMSCCVYIVDGGWSSWTYGPCSKTCGGGTQTLTRKCDNPAHDCGGMECSGLAITQNTCNDHCCPGM